ncbi:hypothetical protein P9112_006735 [Eukaryota sp. TZLM1-RC]
MSTGITVDNFSVLTQCDPERFFSILFELYSNPSKAVLEKLSVVASESDVSLMELRKVFTFCLDFVRRSYKTSASPVKVRSELQSRKMPDELIALFLSHYSSHKPPMSSSSAEKAIQSATLIDMDWRFLGNIASSDGPGCGALVQLSLKLADGENEPRFVLFEVTIPEFFAFLSKMERVKSKIDSYY